MGVTGMRDRTSDAAPELVARVRRATELPVGVGLGVSSGAQAAEVAAYADGVIVGSALVRRVLEADDTDPNAGRIVDADDERAGIAAVVELVTDLAAGVRQRD